MLQTYLFEDCKKRRNKNREKIEIEDSFVGCDEQVFCLYAQLLNVAVVVLSLKCLMFSKGVIILKLTLLAFCGAGRCSLPADRSVFGTFSR